MIKWLVRVGINCVLLFAILLVLGVEWWRAIVAALCAFVMLGSIRLWPIGTSADWPMRETRSFGGGTYQVRSLANRLGQRRDRKRRPDSALQHRLHKLASTKLARLDVEWTDDRARELLGDAAYAALQADGFNPDIVTIERIVTALERLDEAAGMPEQAHNNTATGAHS